MIDVRVQNVVHASAVLLRSVAEPQQLTYFVECHVERPAVANESQAIDQRCIVDAVVAVGTPRRRHQAFAFVVANGLRSEEHTSELQSLMRISYAVFCLKKKNPTNRPHLYRP